MHIAQHDSPIEASFEFRLDRAAILIQMERCGKYHNCHNEDEDDSRDYHSSFAHTSLHCPNQALALLRPIPFRWQFVPNGVSGKGTYPMISGRISRLLMLAATPNSPPALLSSTRTTEARQHTHC